MFSRFGGARQHAGKLVHGNDIVIPGKFVGFRRGGTGHNVVKLAAHDQRPCVVQALLRIFTSTQPLRRHRCFFGGI